MTIESNSGSDEFDPWQSTQIYIVLRRLNRLVLPGLAALYFIMVMAWDASYGLQIIGSLAVINVLLGGLEAVAEKSGKYIDAIYDGELDIIEHPDGLHTYLLSLDKYPERLATKKRIVFKVNRPSKPYNDSE
jgi:hypothetical protein